MIIAKGLASTKTTDATKLCSASGIDFIETKRSGKDLAVGGVLFLETIAKRSITTYVKL